MSHCMMSYLTVNEEFANGLCCARVQMVKKSHPTPEIDLDVQKQRLNR